MTTFDLSISTDSTALIRASSTEAEKYVGPYYGPTAMATLRCIVNLAEENVGGVQVDGEELAGRLGIAEKNLLSALERLDHHDAIDLTELGDDAYEVRIEGFLNPPRSVRRAENYPEQLFKEFRQFIANVERDLSASAEVDNDGSIGL